MKITTKEYVDNQIKWMKELHAADLFSTREAVDKVQEDYKYYKEQQNEWRSQLKDQSVSFVTRRELVGAVVAVASISSVIAGFIAWIIQRLGG